MTDARPNSIPARGCAIGVLVMVPVWIAGAALVWRAC